LRGVRPARPRRHGRRAQRHRRHHDLRRARGGPGGTLILEHAPTPAYVFDLDGTLVDSAADLGAALDTLLARHGRARLGLEGTRRLIGNGVPALVAGGFAATGDAAADLPAPDLEALAAEFLAIYEPDIANATRPYPGVVETLERLQERGLGLAVCTNKATRATQRLLAALDLARFFPVVIGGDTGPRKPDPAPLLRAIAELGAVPADAVMVGDSEIDVATARAAHVKVIAVAYGYARVAPAELGADLVIDGLPALLTPPLLMPGPTAAPGH
jgi:phosphoglycolate phosphatase